MLIESAINNEAQSIYILCKDAESAWKSFSSQFEFVQAAGGLVVNAKQEMLFIFRMETWDLPKGKVEKGESLVEGALREVEEECAIAPLQPMHKLCTTWHTYIQKGHSILKATEWYLMAYAGTKTPEPQHTEGITETKWLNAEQLDEVRKNTYPSILDVLASYLGK